MASEMNRHPRATISELAHSEITAWLVLVVSLLLTAAAWQLSSIYVERRAQERFQYEVDDAKFAISKRMQEYEQTLRSGVALFNTAGRVVTRQEWKTFVDTLSIEKYFPGLQGIGFAQWVQPQDKAAVIAGAQAEGYSDFTIKPEGERDAYAPILYLEPFLGRNLRAFGYDMFSDSTRRAAMEYARDSNQASVSGRVVLVQETQRDVQAGFLMYLPIYKMGAALASIEQRRNALQGFVYSPYRINDLMLGILGQGIPELDFQIFDGAAAESGALLFDTVHAWRSASRETARQAVYTATETIHLPGRVWTVVFASRDNFEAGMSSNQPLAVALGGLLVDLLLFAIIWSLSQQRKQVLAKATEMTAELRRSREQFRAITETACDAIVSIDAKGVIIYANPAASTAFERPDVALTGDTLIGASVETLLPERLRDEHQPGLMNLIARARLTPVSATLESVGVRGADVEFPLEISLSSWIADDKIFLTLLMRDISERRKVERLKSEFVSTVSHELRTPLTAIRGALGLLCAIKEAVPAQQSAELIGIAYQNTERLVRLVNDILDLEKLESGLLTLEMRSVGLSALLHECINANQHYALPNQVTLKLLQPVPDVTVWADSNRLMQIMANFISNAIKYSFCGATVTVGASVHDGIVRIEVADTGSGIPDEFKDRIFQRFSQADASDARRKGGSGLGLSISKSIIDLHDGEIGYNSEAGKGSCFYFELPIEVNSLRAEA